VAAPAAGEKLECLENKGMKKLYFFGVDAGRSLDKEGSLCEIEVCFTVHEVDGDGLKIVDVLFELRGNIDVPISSQIPGVCCKGSDYIA